MSESATNYATGIPDNAFEAAVCNDFTSVMITEGGSDAEKHKIVYVNHAFTRLTGYAAEEVLGQTPGLMQGAKTDRQTLADLEEKLSRGEIFRGATTNYRKDGAEFTIEWKVAPVRDEHGQITHHVAVQREVTAR